MAYFIALGILSLAGVVGTVWLVRTDGYGRVPTDPRRVSSREPRPRLTARARRRSARRAAERESPHTDIVAESVDARTDGAAEPRPQHPDVAPAPLDTRTDETADPRPQRPAATVRA